MMKGLFNKVKNRSSRRRFVVSTIRKDEGRFETAVFEVNYFYLPRRWFLPARWKNPDLVVETKTVDEAWEMHYHLTARLAKEYPARIFQEFCR